MDVVAGIIRHRITIVQTIKCSAERAIKLSDREAGSRNAAAEVKRCVIQSQISGQINLVAGRAAADRDLIGRSRNKSNIAIHGQRIIAVTGSNFSACCR